MRRQLHLQAVDLHKERSLGGQSRKPVLKGVSFAVSCGEVIALLGPSGGGKSTLLRLLNRLEEPDLGSVMLSGDDIRSLDPLQLRRRIAMVPQRPFLFEGSVEDNLRIGYHCRQQPPASADSPEWSKTLAACQVDRTLLGQDARRLSVGQQQRVCLARALLGGSEVLLLDEPTSALDPPTAKRFIETFRQLAEEHGLTQVIVTHDLQLASSVADRVLFLKDGLVLEEGDPDVIMTRPQSEELKCFLSKGGADQ